MYKVDKPLQRLKQHLESRTHQILRADLMAVAPVRCRLSCQFNEPPANQVDSPQS